MLAIFSLNLLHILHHNPSNIAHGQIRVTLYSTYSCFLTICFYRLWLLRWWLHDPGLPGWNFNPPSRGIFHPDYMWKLNFITVRRDSFPPAICLDLQALSLNFFCKHVSLRNWKPIDFHWFKKYLLELFSLQLCLFFFIK